MLNGSPQWLFSQSSLPFPFPFLVLAANPIGESWKPVNFRRTTQLARSLAERCTICALLPIPISKAPNTSKRLQHVLARVQRTLPKVNIPAIFPSNRARGQMARRLTTNQKIVGSIPTVPFLFCFFFLSPPDFFIQNNQERAPYVFSFLIGESNNRVTYSLHDGGSDRSLASLISPRDCVGTGNRGGLGPTTTFYSICRSGG